MIKILIFVVVTISLIYFAGFIGSLVMNNNESKEAIYISHPLPSPSGYPNPTIKSSELDKNTTLVEVDEFQLSVKIPSSWQYSLSKDSVVTIYKNDIPTHYQGSLLLENPEKGTRIGMLPNLQGGWCEGPNPGKKEVLPMKFGLPATKFTCGHSYYVYADLDAPGSAVPNLFVSVDNDSDPQVKDIISSISYVPAK